MTSSWPAVTSSWPAVTSATCVLIGEGNILLSSLQQLTTFGCRVKAVFSNTEHVRAWCEQNKVPAHPRAKRLDCVMQPGTFDYLFSINNPRVLKEEELRLARELNVNYHDSLLPAYAGVNASSWALLNGERGHGVTLHVIEVGIDTGHVLEREEVPILPNDSALSLNLRCVEAFQTAFTRLLQNITTSSPLVPKVQDSSLRSYYGLHACPPNMGLLDFTRDFETVYNLARALQYGHYENPLGSPKILTSSGRYLLVTNAESTERGGGERTAPGSILDIVDDTLIVRTATAPVLLSVAELNGSPIHGKKFQPYGLTPSSVLQSPRGPPADVMCDVRKKEAFWRRKMRQYEPTMFLSQKLNIVSDVIDVSDSINVKEVTLRIFPKEIPDEVEDVESLLLTSFVSFLARICCTNLVHVGLVADKSDIPVEYRDLYADICPGIFDVDLSLTSKSVFVSCFEAIDKYRTSRTFLTDMTYRYPELDERRREMHHNLVVATETQFTQDARAMERVLADCNILLVLTLSDVRIFYNDKPNHDYKHIVDNLRNYPAYVTSLCSLSGQQTLLDVELLSAEEKAILYPSMDHSEPEESDLYALFEEQCRASSLATALKTTSHTMTYRQTERAVSQLADLMKQNLPESYRAEKRCIGLHLPNSTAYVLSVLASLKARCPFLPLPVDLPTHRLAFTLNDAKVDVMLTTDVMFHSDKFKSLPSLPKVLMEFQTPDTTLVLLEFEIDENENVTNQGEPTMSEVYSFDNLTTLDCEEAKLKEDCCYVMYTSGSTGKPKGVQVREPGLVNLARAQIEAWKLGPSDTTAQFASIGFDASISEIVTALLSGGTLAVLQEKERLGKEFVDTLRELEVSVITLPPSVLNIYSPRHLPTLKKIVTAGEACMSHIAFKWTKDDPDIKFFNAYGPTETTVCATIYEFCKEDYPDLANQELAIGTAVKGATVYLLDDFMKPVPPEVVGEIYIGGAGVSGGYIGHASDKNDSRFIPNPLHPARETVENLHQPLRRIGTPDNGISSWSGTTNGKLPMKRMNGKKVTFLQEAEVIDNPHDTNGNNGLKLNGFCTPEAGKVKPEAREEKRERGRDSAQTLYRTGDHAFQDKQGRLTFVGRLDSQVKIRGQRVDLSEIEQVILQHPKVEMAAVVKHKCASCAEPSIAAFVAPTFIYSSELKEYLSRALPKYMIPTHIRKLKAREFPTSINGKVNRRALEGDESVHESQLNVGSSHLNEAQLTMAKLWCRVLGMEEGYAYSLHRLSSFSQLGGNSLHLVIMQRLIEDTFRVHLSFIDIGAADTIESFTDIIKRKKDMLKVDTAAEDHSNAEKLRKTILEDSTLDLKSLFPDKKSQDDDENGNGVPQLIKDADGIPQYMNRGRRRSSVFGESLGPVKILISGVTGFLGAFLLHELLEQTEALVLCMVREKSEAKGMGRVVENLKRYELWRASFFPRLAIVLSDVSLPRLGIAPDIYHALCTGVDVVFINAAKMNFNTCYDDHRQANVLGTKEFLRFAMTGKKKFLFLTSSLSVFLFPEKARGSYPGDNCVTNGRIKDEAEEDRSLSEHPVVMNGLTNCKALESHPERTVSNLITNGQVQAREESVALDKQGPRDTIKKYVPTKKNGILNGHLPAREVEPHLNGQPEMNGHSTMNRHTLVNGHPTLNGHSPIKVNPQMNGHLPTDKLPSTNDHTETNGHLQMNSRSPKTKLPPVNGHIPAKKGEATNKHPLMKESDFLDDPLLVEGGYGQSKWASERLVLQALNHLPGGAIFRPARVSGRSTDGAGPTNDLFASCLIGMQEMGSVPDLDFPFDLTPVDFCAKSMVEITLKCMEAGGMSAKRSPAGSGNNHRSNGHSIPNLLSRLSVARRSMPRVYHLFNGDTMPFRELFKDTGLPILPLDEWRKELRKEENNPLLLPLTPFFLSQFWDRAERWPVFDTTNTDTYVSEATKLLLQPSKDLQHVYRRYFGLQK